MKIKIALNKSSISRAIEKIKSARNALENEMVEELLTSCCKWIRERANYYLELSEIGSNVKSDIENGWIIGQPQDGNITMTNTADKAAFVEFGVGIAGEQLPHPLASESRYEYNVQSGKKDENGVWRFRTNVEDLDLPQSALMSNPKLKDKRGRLFVATTGTKATMYVFNAITDFSAGDNAKKIWQSIIRRHWK